METKCEIDIGGKTMEFSTGKLAMQANSVLVKFAGNGVLVTAVWTGSVNIPVSQKTVAAVAEKLFNGFL